MSETKPAIMIANHCIRELEYDEVRHDWYAKLIRVEDGAVIVIGDLGYILQFVNTDPKFTIIETGGFE